ncbi:MAG: hypothetical protein AB1633_03325, partial [Elusimicrobiota bacterium]
MLETRTLNDTTGALTTNTKAHDIRFTASKTGDITSVYFYKVGGVKKLTMQLRDDSNSFPGPNILAGAEIPSAGNLTWEGFATNVTVTQGNVYHILIYPTAGGTTTGGAAVFGPLTNIEPSRYKNNTDDSFCLRYTTNLDTTTPENSSWYNPDDLNSIAAYRLVYSGSGDIYQGNVYVTCNGAALVGGGLTVTNWGAIETKSSIGTYIKPPETIKIAAIRAYLWKEGLPADNLYVRITEDLTPTNVILATTTFNISGLGAAWNWMETALYGPQLTVDTGYRIYFFSPASSESGTAGGNCYHINRVGANSIAFDVQTCNFVDTAVDLKSGRSTNLGNTWTWNEDTDISMCFVIDETKPSASIIQPVNNTWRKNLPGISGTATDNYLIKTYGVKLFIKEEGISNQRWTEAGWTSYLSGDEYNYGYWVSTGPASTTAGQTINWFYDNPGWSHDKKYTIYTRVADAVDNYSLDWSTAVFYYDLYQSPPNERPDSICNLPSNNSILNSLSIISGTGKDNSQGGINNVKWILWKGGNGGSFDVTLSSYWNGTIWTQPIPSPSSWPDPNAVIPAGGTDPTWTRTTLLPGVGDMDDGTTYYVTSQAEDRVVNSAGNPDPNYEVTRTTITFWWDSVEPESRVTVPAQDSFRSALLTISGTASDTVAVDSLRIRIKSNGLN